MKFLFLFYAQIYFNFDIQMQEVFITRVVHFNAAHKLWNSNWSDEKNIEQFGKCANPNYHGHNYELHVTAKGKIDPDTGYAINASELKKVMMEKVVDIADHRNLNIDVPFMKGRLTSSENFAVAIWEQLKPSLDALGTHLHKIKLIETNNIYVEYYGN
jgi:6-pyruvoyltetrahydropterin/6-carboxytetrahydropterin synthase